MHPISYNIAPKKQSESLERITYADLPKGGVKDLYRLRDIIQDLDGKVRYRKRCSAFTSCVYCPFIFPCVIIPLVACFPVLTCSYVCLDLLGRKEHHNCLEKGLDSVGCLMDKRPPNNNRELCCTMCCTQLYCTDLPEDAEYYLRPQERAQWNETVRKIEGLISKLEIFFVLGDFARAVESSDLISIALDYLDDPRFYLYRFNQNT
jgi:hypothetical protein